MQIDQKPGEYRIQRDDGSWTQRVNKPMCRWLGLASLAFLAYLSWQGMNEGIPPFVIPCAAIMGFAAGGLITLSLKSIDW